MHRQNHRNRWYLAALGALLLTLVTIVFWQTSLSFGEFHPSGAQETILLWAISTLVFLGMVSLGFILFRDLLKLYIARRANQLGSKIRTKLVAGALGLTILPVVFLFFFAFSVLNRTMDRWFNQPIDKLQRGSLEISQRLQEAAEDKAATLAEWLASLPEVAAAGAGRLPADLGARLRAFAASRQLSYVAVVTEPGPSLAAEYADEPALAGTWQRATSAKAANGPVAFAVRPAGAAARVVVGWRIPQDVVAKRESMAALYRAYDEQRVSWRFVRYAYVGMLSLITLFILFVAAWAALFLSRQIVAPIEAMAKATLQVSRGRLDYRIDIRAIDELAMLMRSFNEMTQQLEQSRDQLEARRRFTEAILERIPTGVISLSPDGEIQRVNPALGRIFPPERVAQARRLDNLFSGEDAAEVRRLIRRAQRTGLASGPLDITDGAQTQHLAVTVAAVEPEGRLQPAGAPRGSVIVIEDTSELLRAQKSAAWQEVARRVAHEIKNPLTPIALSAERMSRLVDRYRPHQDVATRLELERLLHNCTETITREVGTLQTLVDEFSQFARFPSAQPAPGDLNEIVETALDACEGRLDGLHISKTLAAGLPPVPVDPEVFKRAIVNLLENALESMRDQPGARELSLATALGAGGDTVELVVADTGHGIAPEDREKLFLPYFSTRKRGTGLGLAIVSRIVAEHKGSIRVEDNHPRGARFVVEIPLAEVKTPAQETPLAGLSLGASRE